MTNEQILREQKRIRDLNLILDCINYAKRRIQTQKNNYKFMGAFAGQGEKIEHRIEILNAAINRLNNRYFKVLNK